MNLFSCLHTLVCWLAQVTPSHSPLFGLYLAVKLLPTHIYHFCLRMWCGWLAQVDSNHRPRAYQARALTTWAMSHYRGRPRSRDSPSFFSFRSPCARNCCLPFWFFCVRLPKRWWRWWDSNPWPPACRAGALPAELHPHFLWDFAFSPKDPSKLNNESITQTKPSFYVAYIL